ncbi:alpha-xenorhabdolysin family binary toxin subunit A [Bacillus wiedmannii]|uniref:alpha-xenorhabdolysin family binary toxin subunit A n=1 Tax=Bacillus cereus group TaxID=86661 RepID=UPI001F0972C8|nr:MULTISPECIES: alpha-xenorhabdolysin family binary toxin subunit A [Bacillus cereus group]MCX3316537.1 alpha-xenorhabdolysin family binary toxin subunit A [Bacillus wiedmannii]WOA60780.1 alpha-xenorhabdolysin family binary toxin subunit A [Bacillus mycoides]
MAKKDLSPRDLGGTENPFLLKKDEWVKIQTYTADGSYVPVNELEMRKVLALNSSAELPDFSELYSVYSNIKTHCSNWKDKTFGKVINTAHEIVNYSRRASVYYQPLNDYLPDILDGDEVALDKFKRLCVKLASEAEDFTNQAAALEEEVGEFATNTDVDAVELGNVKDKYDKLYGETSETVKQLRKEVNDLQKELKEYVEDYKDFEEKSWLSLLAGPIFGFIIKGILDSTEGKRLQAKIEATKQKIEANQGVIQRNVYLMSLLDNTDSGTDRIQQAMNDAIPVIKKIKNIWGAIHADLKVLSEIIMEDIHDDPDFADLGIEYAINQWEAVGKQADDFRINADVGYITEPVSA